MNIVILGAGEVGELLARSLRDEENNITIVDSAGHILDKLRTRLDVMTVAGDCADFDILRKAGMAEADLVVAATGNDAVNILSCQLGKHLGVDKTICRLSTEGFFSIEDGFTPDKLGIDAHIFSEDECLERILAVLRHDCLLEKINFRLSDACLAAARVPSSSPLAGVRIRDFPDKALLSNIRFSALIRSRRLIMPKGDTILTGGDEVYLSGSTPNIVEVLSILAPEASAIHKVVVAGGGRLGVNLVARLLADGFDVKVVNNDIADAERLLDQLTRNITVVCGDPTDSEVLEEAGVGDCDAFVSLLPDDESSILCCVLAKQMGAGKVVAMTKKLEYRDIVPAMGAVDCGFNVSLVTVNSILNKLGERGARVHAILQRCRAFVYELVVQRGAPICGKKIMDYEKKWPAIVALAFRNGQLVPASGELELRAGDRLALIADKKTFDSAADLFTSKNFF